MILDYIRQTTNRFDDLRLRTSVIDRYAKKVSFVFSFPTVLKPEDRKLIVQLVKSQTPEGFTASVQFVRDYFDAQLAEQQVKEVLSDQFQSLYHNEGAKFTY